MFLPPTPSLCTPTSSASAEDDAMAKADANLGHYMSAEARKQVCVCVCKCMCMCKHIYIYMYIYIYIYVYVYVYVFIYIDWCTPIMYIMSHSHMSQSQLTETQFDWETIWKCYEMVWNEGLYCGNHRISYVHHLRLNPRNHPWEIGISQTTWGSKRWIDLTKDRFLGSPADLWYHVRRHFMRDVTHYMRDMTRFMRDFTKETLLLRM